jgi:hypothetical protein
MPNWCDNTISITGDRVRINNLWSSMKDENGDPCLMSACPIPEEHEENWFDWCIKNWGTKWPMDPYSIDKGDTWISVSGVTAWGPPLELLAFISRNWEVRCEIGFSEPGMDFAGFAVFSGGVMSISESSISEYMSPDVKSDDFDAWHNEWSEALDRALDTHENAVSATLSQ